MDDAANYKGLTKDLYSTGYYNNPVIDNILISNELFGYYVENSVENENFVTQIISDYYETTSGHIPVRALFRLTNAAGGDNLSSPHSKVYSANKTIIVENQTAQSVSVCDIMGKQLFFGNNILTANVPITQSGIYIMKSGTEVHKIVVQ
jgi:hypothetical protein